MQESIRVVLADDHPVVLKGLRAALSAADDIVVVADTQTTAGICELCHAQQATVLILDVNMPGEGFAETVARLRQEYPAVAIIVLSAVTDPRCIRAARKLGVAAYLLKTESVDHLATTIRTVVRGVRWYPRHALKHLSLTAPQPETEWGLTARELEVLQALAHGCSNKQIAARLGVSVYTVRNHTCSIYTKIGVTSRTAAVVWALEHKNVDATF